MVTVELAVTTLAAMALLMTMAWGVYLLVMQVRLIDTAAAVARQTARGDRAAVTRLKAAAPAGADIAVSERADRVTVTVRLSARPLAEWLVRVPLTAQAQVVPEPRGEP
jgi:hypothetical protein